MFFFLSFLHSNLNVLNPEPIIPSKEQKYLELIGIVKKITTDTEIELVASPILIQFP